MGEMCIRDSTCTVCGYEYLTDTVKATDHDYTTRVVREPHCETAGERIFHCEKCGDEYYTEIPATGHNFELAESSVVDVYKRQSAKCAVIPITPT